MPRNPFMTRQWIRQQVDDIDQRKGRHKQAINYLLTTQRRLTRFVATQSGRVKVGSRRTKLFVEGVVLRIFDLAGGRLGRVTDEHLRDAERRVSAWAAQCLPPDDGFAARVRAIEDRAQPHLVDECLVSIFDDEELDRAEMAKMFFLVWVVIEALDAAWTPPGDFEGEVAYRYVPMEGDP